VRERLRLIWLDPQALDPARKRTAVTRDIATLLARLALALEAKGHPAQQVASFLMRAIFCMFAQSVGLLPSGSFSGLLEACRAELQRSFVIMMGDLWRTMNEGGYSSALHAAVLRFNGGLFRAGVHGAVEPLPIDAEMLELLLKAASRDWADVEPAIFGTLLENALEKRQRDELGAHFTPRAFVERLVLPTVMEPLRADWDGVKVAAVKLAETDRAGAAKLLAEFHAQLCQMRVLDPACGTGNFLYVTLELMKRLEGEVLDLLVDLAAGEGDRLAISGASVDPHQFLGMEKNPRAVPVAELVLWIGYLQWHFRTRGKAPPAEPILRDFRNIQEKDALLDYAEAEPERDARGAPASQWDGRTFKLHPITGEEVPDESARVLVLRPVGAKPAVWPEADFIIGNPPFIAGKDLRAELGEGYAEALWAAYPKGASVGRSGDVFLVEGGAVDAGAGGWAASVWFHWVEQHQADIQPAGDCGSAGGETAFASGARDSGSSVGGWSGDGSGANCDDGGGAAGAGLAAGAAMDGGSRAGGEGRGTGGGVCGAGGDDQCGPNGGGGCRGCAAVDGE
jgi:hypothetical protein